MIATLINNTNAKQILLDALVTESIQTRQQIENELSRSFNDPISKMFTYEIVNYIIDRYNEIVKLHNSIAYELRTIPLSFIESEEKTALLTKLVKPKLKVIK